MDLDTRVAFHAALADPIRLRIVDELGWSDRTPSELGGRLRIESNLLAHHLDVLERAAIIDRTVSRGDRRRRYLRLRPLPLAATPAAVDRATAGVVFVCTANSARSQLAATLWNATSAVPAISRGTEPADAVHPEAVRAAARLGLDLRSSTPTLLDPASVTGRLVVTVCDVAHEDLDRLGDIDVDQVVHWSIADPAANDATTSFDDAAAALDLRIADLAPRIHRLPSTPPTSETP